MGHAACTSPSGVTHVSGWHELTRLSMGAILAAIKRCNSGGDEFSTPPLSMFPLRRFVDQLTPQMKTVGALIMNSIPFGRNASVPLEVLEPNTQQQPPPPLVMDYTFRHQKDTPREIKHHRWKCIYHAPVAQVISVHNLDQGGEKRYMDVSTQVRVNHYKSPQTVGVYQAAPNQLTQDSSLPDRYRELDFS
jgi:hypothetical protein